MQAVGFIIVCSLFIWVFTGAAWGREESADKTKQLEELQQRIGLLQNTLDKIENKKNSVRAELRESERLYGNISVVLQRLNDQIRSQEKRLEARRRERDLNQKKFLRLKASVVRQIRAAHAMGRQEKLQLILNQREASKIERIWTYYHYFAEARAEHLKSFHATLERLQSSEQELSVASDRLKDLRKDKQAEADSLEKAGKERKRLLAELERDSRNRATELKRLEQDQRRLESLIQAVQAAAKDVAFRSESRKSFANSRGRLRWPVDGKLVQGYGISTASGRTNGVLIEAREGDPVHAVAAGRVIYADWLVRYGLLMIVDHGKGFMTLYAFNQSLYKSVGDTVESGELIAAVGRSGGRSIPALYFEVREQGEAVNPAVWFTTRD